MKDLASLLHHYASGHENFVDKNAPKVNLSNPDTTKNTKHKINKQPSYLKTKTQTQVKQQQVPNTVLNQINKDDKSVEPNKEIMLHDLIKADPHHMPAATKQSETANIKQKEYQRSSNEMLNENLENMPNDQDIEI